jgi:hypothetical protein
MSGEAGVSLHIYLVPGSIAAHSRPSRPPVGSHKLTGPRGVTILRHKGQSRAIALNMHRKAGNTACAKLIPVSCRSMVY